MPQLTALSRLKPPLRPHLCLVLTGPVEVRDAPRLPPPHTLLHQSCAPLLVASGLPNPPLSAPLSGSYLATLSWPASMRAILMHPSPCPLGTMPVPRFSRCFPRRPVQRTVGRGVARHGKIG